MKLYQKIKLKKLFFSLFWGSFLLYSIYKSENKDSKIILSNAIIAYDWIKEQFKVTTNKYIIIGDKKYIYFIDCTTTNKNKKKYDRDINHIEKFMKNLS